MERLLVPYLFTIESVIAETADVKTFRMRPKAGQLSSAFNWLPGQFVEFSLPGYGECTFCISCSATRGETIECSVKNAGQVTGMIHKLLEPGMDVGIRGPYGNHFPFEELKGRNLLFIGGGIGLAPLRSFIQYVLDRRSDFAKVTVLYGARTPGDLVYKEELDEWGKNKDLDLFLTVDKGDDTWNDNVGVVPKILEEVVKPSIENTSVITCGPPIMIKFTIQSLLKLGFDPKNIITTLEMRMQCGLGKCGRCNIGSVYVCKDGPVFTYEQLMALPAEY
jgi:sulfhydrogenase subunit gamma (sulfur reductase)